MDKDVLAVRAKELQLRAANAQTAAKARVYADLAEAFSALALVVVDEPRRTEH